MVEARQIALDSGYLQTANHQLCHTDPTSLKRKVHEQSDMVDIPIHVHEQSDMVDIPIQIHEMFIYYIFYRVCGVLHLACIQGLNSLFSTSTTNQVQHKTDVCTISFLSVTFCKRNKFGGLKFEIKYHKTLCSKCTHVYNT